jgi:hypothetical protein
MTGYNHLNNMPFINTLRQRFRDDLRQKTSLLKIHTIVIGILLIIVYLFVNSGGPSQQRIYTAGPSFDRVTTTSFGSVEHFYGRGLVSAEWGELEGCYTNYWNKDHRLIVAIGRNFCYLSPHGRSLYLHAGFAFIIGFFYGIPLILLSFLLYILTIKIKSRWVLHIVLLPVDLAALIIWFTLIPFVWFNFQIPFTPISWP